MHASTIPRLEMPACCRAEYERVDEVREREDAHYEFHRFCVKDLLIAVNRYEASAIALEQEGVATFVAPPTPLHSGMTVALLSSMHRTAVPAVGLQRQLGTAHCDTASETVPNS
ncbi:hypothetical protein POJ06DRAFT_239537 [Lipomyces tetrasporus]|uniref:Uncharacterized protein n=1 Tax=Lipomyces tetrasporus TaxID=54092 RepID=A0AAD7QNU1_9ASCO|nr:uncharacterized protein POJ06DRAFT_239537 [Lipomyces tetrasporus]KAJ8098656.1 hypothetical protein POJ06DRAFT_239537 [Lipomyces tetrasporus]